MMVSDTWDLLAFIAVAAAVLLVAIMSAYEGIRVDFSKRGKDFRSGSHQRNVFYFAILVASLFKFICMTVEAIQFHDAICADSHLCSFLRFSPDIMFMAAYAVMLTFWTQLGYDISGVSSRFPRIAFWAGVGTLAGLFFPLMLLHPKDEPNYNLFLFLGIAHLVFIVATVSSGMWVSKHISSSVTIGHRILNRLVALCIACCFSSVVGSVLYLFIMHTVWTKSYPNQRLLLFDAVVVLVKDVIPLYLVMQFTSKNTASNQTQRSMLSTVPLSTNHPYTRISEV